ncbi:serine protease [Hyaloraphidium curvatum]|nr:serine protease [Hyaloraphidium curvatum]
MLPLLARRVTTVLRAESAAALSSFNFDFPPAARFPAPRPAAFRADPPFCDASLATAHRPFRTLSTRAFAPPPARRFSAMPADTKPTADAASAPPTDPEDPWTWLEDVTGEKALAFASERNSVSKSLMEKTSPAFPGLQARILSILDSKDKIPMIAKHGKDPKTGKDWYYNLWKDEKNKRGLWRRTFLDSYRTDTPDWETVLDIDELGAQEGENWVYSGSVFLEPESRYCLLYLSRGGADATVVREFDVHEKRFIDEANGGFVLPEAKSRVSWRNKDSVFVGTVFPGVDDSLTDSGYPRIVREWERGTPLSASKTVYEGTKEDVSVSGYRDLAEGYERDFVERGVTFWTNESFFRDEGGNLIKIRKQDDAEARVHKRWLFLELRSDWEPVEGAKYKAGSLLATDFDAYVKDAAPVTKNTFSVLFEPTERKSLASFDALATVVAVNELDNVRNRVYVLTPPSGNSTEWKRKELTGFPDLCTVALSSVDPDFTDEVFCIVSGYLTPSSLYFGDLARFAGEDGAESPLQLLKRTPEFFDARGLKVEQHFVPSIHDGTSIPYFQVSKEGLALDGKNHTLLYGYGGFEISLTPGYQATTGVGWLERGGVYVVANIRGGGEFGPAWHQAALKANRNIAYADFASVARDLVKRGITSPRYLGCMGGSNGGLLVGNMYTQYPADFGAVVCQVPLLDMKRFSKLLAGASWMGEYGNPDTSDWDFIKTFSPYHLTVPPPAHRPSILFYTSTRDDRVHPGHARKMVARLLKERGYPEGFLDGEGTGGVLYFENIEGGHGGAADNTQQAFMSALGWEFLYTVLAGGKEKAKI